MSTLPPESPPPSPSAGVTPGLHTMPIGIAPECVCGAVSSSLSVNQVADTLGVSPLYKQQESVLSPPQPTPYSSARWTAARHQYLNSSCHSPIQEAAFFPDIPEALSRPTRTPLSLEEIAAKNRKRHDEVSLSPFY